MYATMVLQMGIAPDYILDRMEFYEMEILFDNIWMKDKSSWEQTRDLMYITAQVNSTKSIDRDTFLRFPWEVDIAPTEDSEEDRQRLLEEMKMIKDTMNCK